MCARVWRLFLQYFSHECPCACTCARLWRTIRSLHVCVTMWVAGRCHGFVFVMITRGGIKPEAARWSLSVWERHSTEPSWRVLGQAQQKHWPSHNTSFGKIYYQNLKKKPTQLKEMPTVFLRLTLALPVLQILQAWLHIWNIPLKSSIGVSSREGHVMTTGLNSGDNCVRPKCAELTWSSSSFKHRAKCSQTLSYIIHRDDHWSTSRMWL